MDSISIIVLLVFYLGLLFVVARWAEKFRNGKLLTGPYVYALSIAVYCSAWTYYGSIGVAATSGIDYLTVYIGPLIAFPFWYLIIRKIVRISRINKISSIADLLALRYGNSRSVGAWVSLLIILAVIPYLALQLKAISETFHVVTHTDESSSFLLDSASYVILIIAAFSAFYGSRFFDASEKRPGMIAAVALESILKLLFLLLVGIFVVYFVFDGSTDLYNKASELEGFAKKNRIDGAEGAVNWFFLSLLSFLSFFLLPRQFHVSVVENRKEKHLKTAAWLVPLYLFFINLFVFPIAWGGNVLFEGEQVNADVYALLIPQYMDNQVITLLVFLGGLSATVSMTIVASVSLSVMLTNNLILPFGLSKRIHRPDFHPTELIVRFRQIGIFLLLMLAFVFYRSFAMDYSMVSVGMIAFVLIAQLAPAFFGGLYWKTANRKGVLWGMLTGVLIVLVLLVFPAVLKAFKGYGLLEIDMDEFGGAGILDTIGMGILDPIPAALWWSLLFNTFVFVVVSILAKTDYRQRNYAEMFVDIDHYVDSHINAFVWRGTAYISDVEKILVRFLGEERTQRALRIFRQRNQIAPEENLADARFIKFAENLLAGRIGTSSARILIQGVTKEEKISLNEVLRILEESKRQIEQNKELVKAGEELRQLSEHLQSANEALLTKDKEKDEFLNIVTHELRTPITAIRSASEILRDDDELPEEFRNRFLENIIVESDRLNGLISEILDLERFDSGKNALSFEHQNLNEILSSVLETLNHLFVSKNIRLIRNGLEINTLVWVDPVRIYQVLTNLIGNALKYAEGEPAIIEISVTLKDSVQEVEVSNNGPKIPEEELDLIFDKFYQSADSRLKKTQGSGLGLAICRRIILAHHGEIWAENKKEGVAVCFSIPLDSREKPEDSL